MRLNVIAGIGVGVLLLALLITVLLWKQYESSTAVVALTESELEARVHEIASMAWREQVPEKPLASCLRSGQRPRMEHDGDAIVVTYGWRRHKRGDSIEQERIILRVDAAGHIVEKPVCTWSLKPSSAQVPAPQGLEKPDENTF